jgi:hypothetical protein
MTLRRCPSCKNMFAAESVCCPICGCEPAKTYVARAIKWALIALAAGWAVEHYVSKHRPVRDARAEPDFSVVVAV